MTRPAEVRDRGKGVPRIAVEQVEQVVHQAIDRVANRGPHTFRLVGREIHGREAADVATNSEDAAEMASNVAEAEDAGTPRAFKSELPYNMPLSPRLTLALASAISSPGRRTRRPPFSRSVRDGRACRGRRAKTPRFGSREEEPEVEPDKRMLTAYPRVAGCVEHFIGDGPPACDATPRFGAFPHNVHDLEDSVWRVPASGL